MLEEGGEWLERLPEFKEWLASRYLDVNHIAIVYGERDLLELRFGSIRSRDL